VNPSEEWTFEGKPQGGNQGMKFERHRMLEARKGCFDSWVSHKLMILANLYLIEKVSERKMAFL